MLRRISLLVASLLVLIPADALARAGGGSHSFSSPSGGSRGTGRGFGGGHFFFFGGGGGGGFLLLIVIVVVVLFVISRRRQRPS
jgi:uncharacterized membrane protein